MKGQRIVIKNAHFLPQQSRRPHIQEELSREVKTFEHPSPIMVNHPYRHQGENVAACWFPMDLRPIFCPKAKPEVIILLVFPIHTINPLQQVF